MRMKEKEIKVLKVKPHEHPEVYMLKNTLEAMQEAVGGYIDIVGFAVSTGEPPTEEMMQLVQEYVDGKKEISEILEETIQKYHKIATIES